jgi:hypothetical protein
MTAINFEQKGLFVFTGNPLIDNGVSVLALITGKNNFEDITPVEIIDNLEAFFEPIKHQFDDRDATGSEKKHIKKKLSQHLKTIYGTNHYLHGINNYLTEGYEIILKHKKGKPPVLKEIKEIDYFKVNYKHDDNKITIKFVSDKYNKEISNIYIEKLIKKICDVEQDKLKIKALGKKKVQIAGEYFSSLKDEVRYVFQGYSAKLNKPQIKTTDNICNFCGKDSAITLSKDLFPMTSAIGINNLGMVYMCPYCYVASLFFFFNLLNYKSEEKKAGIYFYYHFADEQIMINNAKKQYDNLKNANNLASLQSSIGSRYKVVFEDLYNRIKTICNGTSPQLTIYFLLNHNQDLKVVYDLMTVPNGVLNFWLKLNSMELAGEWGLLYKKIAKHYRYQEFLDGKLTNFVYYFKDNKKTTLTHYLEEVILMNKNLIEICEVLSKQLIKYFEMEQKKHPTRRNNWTEEFYDFFSRKKPYELFNKLFAMNNDYFRWTNGENLISLTSVKSLLDAFKQNSLLYGLIEYFILNSMGDEDKKSYFNYIDQKENK